MNIGCLKQQADSLFNYVTGPDLYSSIFSSPKHNLNSRVVEQFSGKQKNSALFKNIGAVALAVASVALAAIAITVIATAAITPASIAYAGFALCTSIYTGIEAIRNFSSGVKKVMPLSVYEHYQELKNKSVEELGQVYERYAGCNFNEQFSEEDISLFQKETGYSDCRALLRLLAYTKSSFYLYENQSEKFDDFVDSWDFISFSDSNEKKADRAFDASFRAFNKFLMRDYIPLKLHAAFLSFLLRNPTDKGDNIRSFGDYYPVMDDLNERLDIEQMPIFRFDDVDSGTISAEEICYSNSDDREICKRCSVLELSEYLFG